jgi:hypothetical protein
MSDATSEYLAGCHCGALTARFRTALATSAWQVRGCQCSFCRAHAGLTISDPSGSLEFAAVHPEQVQRYRFGRRVTDFLLCRTCGIYVGASVAVPNGRFGVLNTHALRPIPANLPQPVPMNYAAETLLEKQQRREARWTPLTASSL